MPKILTKSFWVTLLMVSVFSLNPNPSYAGLSLFGVPPLAFLGIMTISVGGSLIKMGHKHRGKRWMLIGTVILDEKTQAHPVFGEMSEEVAANLGFDLTDDRARIDAYNSSLTKINLLLEQITYDAHQDSSLNSAEKIRDFVDERWIELGREKLSDDAYAALRKIQTGSVP